MGFVNWVKSKFDDDEDDKIQMRQPNKVKTIRVKQPSSFNRPAEIQRSNVSDARDLFSGKTETLKPEKRDFTAPMPKSRSLVQVAKDNVDPNLGSLRKFSDFTNQYNKLSIEKNEKALKDRGFEKFGKFAGDVQRVTTVPARMTLNAVPTAVEGTMAGAHRVGRTVSDRFKRGNEAQKIFQQTNPQLANAKASTPEEALRLQQAQGQAMASIENQLYAQEMQQRPSSQYSPFTGATNTLEQENFFRQNVLGQSKLKAGAHAALDVGLPFLDVPTGGSSAVVGTGAKMGAMQAAPFLMGAIGNKKLLSSGLKNPLGDIVRPALDKIKSPNSSYFDIVKHQKSLSDIPKPSSASLDNMLKRSDELNALGGNTPDYHAKQMNMVDVPDKNLNPEQQAFNDKVAKKFGLMSPAKRTAYDNQFRLNNEKGKDYTYPDLKPPEPFKSTAKGQVKAKVLNQKLKDRLSGKLDEHLSESSFETRLDKEAQLEINKMNSDINFDLNKAKAVAARDEYKNVNKSGMWEESVVPQLSDDADKAALTSRELKESDKLADIGGLEMMKKAKNKDAGPWGGGTTHTYFDENPELARFVKDENIGHTKELKDRVLEIGKEKKALEQKIMSEMDSADDFDADYDMNILAKRFQALEKEEAKKVDEIIARKKSYEDTYGSGNVKITKDGKVTQPGRFTPDTKRSESTPKFEQDNFLGVRDINFRENIPVTGGDKASKISVKQPEVKKIKIKPEPKPEVKLLAPVKEKPKVDYFEEMGKQMNVFKDELAKNTSVPVKPIKPKTKLKVTPEKTKESPMYMRKPLKLKTEPKYTRPKEYNTPIWKKSLRSVVSGGRELKMMKGGKELFDKLDKSRHAVKTKTGDYVGNFNEIFGKKKTLGERKSIEGRDESRIVDIIENVSGAREHATPELRNQADRLSGLSERVREEAKKVGVKMGKIEGYFPHVYDKEWISGVNANRAAKHLLESGQVDTLDNAKHILSKMKEKISVNGKSLGYEMERKIDLPPEARVKTLQVYENYLRDMAERITKADLFGPNNEKIKSDLIGIDTKGGDAKRAEDIFHMFEGNGERSLGHKVADVATGFQNISKLSLAPVQNLTQQQNLFALAPKNTLKGLSNVILNQKGARDFGHKAGIYDEGIKYKESGMKPSKLQDAALYGVGKSEKFMRTAAAETGRLQAQDLIDKFVKLRNKGKKTKTVSRDLDELYGIDILDSEMVKRGNLTEYGARIAGEKIADVAHFDPTVLSNPTWMHSAAGRVAGQWLKFPYEQGRLMGKTIAKRPKALATIAATAPAAYYGQKIVNNVVRGREPLDVGNDDDSTTKKIADAYGAITGMPGVAYSKGKTIKDSLQDERQSKLEKTQKIGSAILGPSAGTALEPFRMVEEKKKAEADNVKYGKQLQPGDKYYKDPTQYAKRSVSGTIPYAGQMIKNKAFGYENKNVVTPSEHSSSVIKDLTKYPIKKINEIFGNEEYAPKVARVKDGDSIILDNGQEIRLVGMEAPEKETKQGKEATKFLSKMLLDKNVDVKINVDKKDKFGRLIADVSIDGESVSEKMIKEGYGSQLTFAPNVKNIEAYKEYQTTAKAQGKGFWGDPNLKSDYDGGQGKVPGWFSKTFKKQLGEDRIDFNEKTLEKLKGTTSDSVKSVELYDEKGDKFKLSDRKNYSDEDLLDLRAAADGFGAHFIGTRKGGKVNEFAKLELTDKLAIAATTGSGTSSKSVKNKLADVYTAGNYTNKEKTYIMKKMGFTMDDAERVTLKAVKGTGDKYGKGMKGASPVINDYMRDKGFTDKVALNLIEDGTLSSPQIKDMYKQGLINEKEEDHLLCLQSGKCGPNGKSKSGGRSGRSSRTAKKAKTIKFTADKSPKKDYFKGLTDPIKIAKAPKFTNAPKFDKIKSDYKVPEIKASDRKIKFKFK